MMTAALTQEQARSWAADLVESERRQTGSQMTAYETVAHHVGVSASWMRKLVGRQPLVVEAHEYLNLAVAYRKLCERVEAAAETERRRAVAAKESTDATLASAFVLVAGAAEADRSGMSEESR